ncbi:hypothetical protein BGZ65_005283 [Modicella reniformis]|uniref:C2H2-type domain-containing protein n=1 Tax=Modicella reniformis TaxID=1440133 RepID=A0A9P6MM28_9FUNG|nr:hypothetical protein BGZ65_005283 [Modicella reniformis]
MSPCDFETAFCRNFYCCGITLLDLHDLLQHYEECHVQFEEEDDDEDDEDDFDSDGFGYCSHSGESEAFGEEGISGGSGGAGGFWSDSDSAMSRSPSSSSPLMLLDGFSSGSSHSESSSRRASKNRHGHGVAAAVGNLSRQQRSMFDQQLHPLYNNNNPTTHVSEAFSTSFSGSMKRKDVVSLSDLYMEEDGDDVHSSSFSSTILRASNRTDFNKSERMGPLAKHQALDENQHAAAAGAASVPMTGASFTTSNVYPVSLFPGHVILGGNGKPIGPLSSTVDWMCQRDEVFSILEDMTRIPSNASDENKPYRCSVPGCDKAYKNPNGLKYHNQHGHSSSSLADADNPEARPYVCTFLECGKRYKNLNGLKYHIEHTHPNMIAALRAHQAGLLTNPSLLMANGGVYGMNHQAAAMTIAAALAAVEHSPMMAIAANAILTAHTAAAAAAAAAAATAATSSASASAGTPGDGGHETPISAQVSDLALPQVNSCRCGCSDNEWVCKPGHICGPIYHEISIPPVITPATSSMNP